MINYMTNFTLLECMLNRYIGMDQDIVEQTLVTQAREVYGLNCRTFKDVSDFVNSYNLDEDFDLEDWRIQPDG